MSKIQTEDSRFVKDIQSKALLSTDINALHKYRRDKELFKRQQDDYNVLKEKVNKLHDDIEFIKQLLLERIDVSQRST